MGREKKSHPSADMKVKKSYFAEDLGFCEYFLSKSFIDSSKRDPMDLFKSIAKCFRGFKMDSSIRKECVFFLPITKY